MMRSLITIALVATLAISLVYSSAIRHGHADVPVAATAAEVQPLQAPRHFRLERWVEDLFPDDAIQPEKVFFRPLPLLEALVNHRDHTGLDCRAYESPDEKLVLAIAEKLNRDAG